MIAAGSAITGIFEPAECLHFFVPFDLRQEDRIDLGERRIHSATEHRHQSLCRPGDAGLQQDDVFFRIEADMAQYSARTKVGERSKARDADAFALEIVRRADLRRGDELVVDHAQAADNRQVGATEGGGHGRRAGGGQQLHFTRHERLYGSGATWNQQQLSS